LPNGASSDSSGGQVQSGDGTGEEVARTSRFWGTKWLSNVRPADGASATRLPFRGTLNRTMARPGQSRPSRRRQRRPPARPPVPVRTGPEWKPKEHVSGLRLGLSYAAALFLPIVGFVLGLFLLRRTIGHGVAVVLISVAVVVASFTIAVDDDSGGAPSSSPRLERLERRLVHIPNRCLKGQSAHDMLRCVQRPNR